MWITSSKFGDHKMRNFQVLLMSFFLGVVAAFPAFGQHHPNPTKPLPVRAAHSCCTKACDNDCDKACSTGSSSPSEPSPDQPQCNTQPAATGEKQQCCAADQACHDKSCLTARRQFGVWKVLLSRSSVCENSCGASEPRDHKASHVCC